MAAAMGNVDDRDNWRVHFADTMRGGQYLNNWRMAELHAKEAPARVRELEAWGAMFDRTKDGRILQRNFRRASLSAAGARGRSHRSRDDPHAAGSRHSSGHRVPHGDHDPDAAEGWRAVRGRIRLRSRARAVQAVSREGGGAGDGRHRARVSDHAATVGSIRATDTRWRIRRARRCWTWSSCSSIRRGWSGRPA